MATTKPANSIADIARWVEFKTRLGAPLHDTVALLAALKAHGGEPTPLDEGQEPMLVMEAPAVEESKPEPAKPVVTKKK